MLTEKLTSIRYWIRNRTTRKGLSCFVLVGFAPAVFLQYHTKDKADSHSDNADNTEQHGGTGPFSGSEKSFSLLRMRRLCYNMPIAA